MHADWQGQQGCRGMAGNMLTISRSLTLVACSPTPLSSAPSATGGLPTLEMRGYNCVSLTMPAPSLSLSLSFSLSPPFPSCLTLNLLSPPLVALPLAALVILFIPPPYLYLFTPSLGCLLSHILALLINNPPPSQPPLSSFSAFCISSYSMCLTSPLKRMSDGVSSHGAILIRLHRSRDVTPPCTSSFCFSPSPPCDTSSNSQLSLLLRAW